MRNLLLILITSFLILSCNKEEPPYRPEPVEPEPTFKMVWEKLMAPDSLQRGYTDTYLYNDILVLNRDRTFQSSPDDIVYARNANTGEILWEWYELDQHYDHPGRVQRIATFENYYMCSYIDSYHCIDVNTGQTVWSNGPDPEVSRQPHYFAHGKNVYGTQRTRSNDDFSVYQINIKTGEKKSFYSSSVEGELETHLYSPEEYVDNNGDTIIVFQDRKYDNSQDFHLDKEWVQLLAFNLSADTLLWKIDTLETQSISSISVKPIVKDDMIYFAGKSLYGVHLETGEIKWTTEITRYPVWEWVWHDGFIYASKGDSKTFCIDPETGNKVWETDLGTGSSTGVIIYDPYIIVCGIDIKYLHKTDGKIEYTLPVYNKEKDIRCTFLGQRPSLSEDGKYIYISDTFFDICFENPAY